MAEPCNMLVSNQRLENRYRPYIEFSADSFVCPSYGLERWFWIQRLAATEPSRRIEKSIDGFGKCRMDPCRRSDAVLLLDPRTRIATNLQSRRRPIDARIRTRLDASKSDSAETKTLAYGFLSMGIRLRPLRYGRHKLVSNSDSLRERLPTSAIR